MCLRGRHRTFLLFPNTHLTHLTSHNPTTTPRLDNHLICLHIPRLTLASAYAPDAAMAPRKKTEKEKEKEDEASGAEGADMILHYLSMFFLLA